MLTETIAALASGIVTALIAYFKVKENTKELNKYKPLAKSLTKQVAELLRVVRNKEEYIRELEKKIVSKLGPDALADSLNELFGSNGPVAPKNENGPSN